MSDVKELQRSLNRFTGRWLENVAPIIVDGDKGPATNRRIMTVKFYLGYGDRDGKVTPQFVRRMRHPKSPLYSTPRMLITGARRRKKQRQFSVEDSHPAPGIAMFDGRPVATWLHRYLVWARQHGWQGTLNSGWRSPAYSEWLCIQICNRPSCPGVCAGRSSNHTKKAKPEGAIDVSDYATFGNLMQRCPHSPRIFNALGPRDPVHFSTSGR